MVAGKRTRNHECNERNNRRSGNKKHHYDDKTALKEIIGTYEGTM
jgi:hypothetical protein